MKPNTTSLNSPVPDMLWRLLSAVSLAFILLGLSSILTVDAKPKHQTPPGLAKQDNAKLYKASPRTVDRSYSGQHNAIITTQFNNRSTGLLQDLLLGRAGDRYISNSLVSQLQQQRDLPPGIAKNVARGKPLPPGIAKKMTYLPNSSLQYLGYGGPYQVGIYGRDAILINAAAGIVSDIIRNVF